ncbi:hypothetical protein JCM5350_001323 [Sporobolomyces pararoseus]
MKLSNKCDVVRIEVEGGNLFNSWDQFPAWSQIECLGYTKSARDEILKTKDHYTVTELRKRRSEANQALESVCPTVENYLKILSWKGAPTSFLNIIKRPLQLSNNTSRSSAFTPASRYPQSKAREGATSRVERSNLNTPVRQHHHRPMQLSWQNLETPETFSRGRSASPPHSPSPAPASNSHTSPEKESWTDWLNL